MARLAKPLRILAIDSDTAFLRQLQRSARRAGFFVVALNEPRLAAAKAIELEPDLVLVGHTVPEVPGPQLVRGLKSLVRDRTIPVACIADGDSEAIGFLCAGAVEVFHKPFGPEQTCRLQGLAEALSAGSELSDEPGSEGARRLLCYFRRTERSGTWAFNVGTPFESRVQFMGGELVSAECGMLRGVSALQELVGLDESAWRPVPSAHYSDVTSCVVVDGSQCVAVSSDNLDRPRI